MPLMPLMPFNAHCSEPVLDTAAGVLRLRAPGMTELVVPLEPTPEQLRHPVKAKVWRDVLEAYDAGDDAAAWFTTFLKSTRVHKRLLQGP